MRQALPLLCLALAAACSREPVAAAAVLGLPLLWDEDGNVIESTQGSYETWMLDHKPWTTSTNGSRTVCLVNNPGFALDLTDNCPDCIATWTVSYTEDPQIGDCGEPWDSDPRFRSLEAIGFGDPPAGTPLDDDPDALASWIRYGENGFGGGEWTFHGWGSLDTSCGGDCEIAPDTFDAQPAVGWDL